MPFDISILSVKDIIDILLVAFLLYKTQADEIVGINQCIYGNSRVYRHLGLSYRKCCKCVCSVRYSISVGVIAPIVIFQDEIRHFLLSLGSRHRTSSLLHGF